MYSKKLSGQLLDTYKLVNNKTGQEYPIQSTQVLIGKADNCQIQIKDTCLNPLHALMTIVTNDKVFIVDLNSVNGTYVNGQAIQKHQVLPGDIIKIGETELSLEEHYIESENFYDDTRDITLVKRLRPVKDTAGLNDLGNLQREKSREQLFLFEDEWCDINFSDEYNKLNTLEIEDHFRTKELSYYVDTEEKEIYDIYNRTKANDLNIEIVYASCGNIISFDSFELKPQKIKKYKKYLSSDVVDLLAGKDLFKLEDDQVAVRSIDGFQVNKPVDSNGHIGLRDGDVCFTKGTDQIFIRVRKGIPGLNPKLPKREKDRMVYTFLMFLLLFLPSLLLLVVDVIEKPDPPKEVVIIYKPKKEVVQVEESSNAKGENKQENEAPSLNADKSEKVAKAEKTAANEPKKKASKEPKKSTKVNKKVAKKKKAVKKKAKKIAKKVPKIDFSSKFNKLFASGKTSKKSFKGSGSSAKVNANAVAISSQSNIKSVGSSQVGALKTSGKFSGNKGYKTKGLGKSNFDSQLSAFKTVVLGSIDPDLLKKILREYIPQFRMCYQQELSRNASVKGKINLHFTINKFGRVTRSNVSSRNAKFSSRGTNCMGRVLKSIKFPKPKGGGIVEVKQPLNFSSEKTKV